MNNKLTTLLLGSGVALSALAETNNKSEEVSLDPVDLTGEESLEPIAAFEPSFNSKLLVPITELPRSVDIISTEDFREKGARNFQETLNYTAGVFPGPFGLDTRIDETVVRGITPQRFRDGFLSHRGFYNQARTEIYTLESVEVIKGPASTLYGQGALGGIVNSNSKLPKAEAAGELTIEIGTDDRYQVGADITGPIDEKGTLLYRVVTLARDSETEVDHVDDDALVVMPSVTWLPTEQTSITLLAQYQKNDTGSTIQFAPTLDESAGNLAGPFGTLTLPPIASLDVDRKEFMGEPNWDKFETDYYALSAMLEHEIDETFTLLANVRYTESESTYQYHQAVGYSLAPPSLFFGGLGLPPLTEAGDVYRVAYRSENDIEILGSNAILRAEGSLFGLEHNAQFGVDYIDLESQNDRPRDLVLEAFLGQASSGYFLSGSSVNLLNPQSSGNPVVPDATEYRTNELEQVGVFFGDVIKYENWITSFNIRYDYVEQTGETRGVLPDGSDSRYSSWDVDDFTFDAAIMYQFESGFNLYYSYAESFTPNSVNTSSGDVIDPTEGFQHEVGVKYVSESGRTAISTSAFHIKEDNRVIDNDPVITIDATYEGFEFQIGHQVADFLLRASYTYLTTDQDGDAARGSEAPYAPDQMANAWVTWIPSSGGLENFRAGLGARYIGNTLSTTNKYETSGYTLFDMMIGYRFGEVDLQLNVTNLTDKEYTSAFQDTGILGDLSYEGPGRFASITATYSF